MAELVVAMVIIAILLTALIATQIQALQTITEARKLQQATALANESLEKLRAIPWRVLQRGLYSGYNSTAAYTACGLTHGGGDPRVTVTAGVHTLDIEGQQFELVVAPVSQNQNLATPWPPLFNSCGLNFEVIDDPSQTGANFTVRSYVTTPLGDDPNDVGLVVVVEWATAHGIRTTVVSSPSFAALTCGIDTDRSQFAGACQARMSAASRTGGISMVVEARDTLAEGGNNVPIVPGLQWFTLSVNTATTSALGESEQTTKVHSFVDYGGSIVRGDPALETPVQQTNRTGSYELVAANDPGIPGASPAHATPLQVRHPVLPADPDLVKTEDVRTVVNASSAPSFRAHSDYTRPGDLYASTTTSCFTGVSNGQPCALATLDNSASQFSAGYIVMDHDSQTFRWTRRMNETGSHLERSWVARFTDAPSTAPAIGCTTVTGPGCISAGSSRTIGSINVGNFITGSWQGNSAPNGFVTVSNYQDSVMVQRGPSQASAAAVVTRQGSVQFWGQSNSYETQSIGTTAAGPFYLGSATWVSSNPNMSVTVTGGSVQWTGINNTAPTNVDPECITAECTIIADSGTLNVVLNIVVTHPGNPAGYHLISTLSIQPVVAQATFKDAPS